MRDKTIVIVGGGLAGAKAAEAVRNEGFDGRVVLIGDEPERPYERPPLSKEYLQGQSSREDVYVHPANFYDRHDIELWTQTHVEALDPASSEVVLPGGKRLRFHRLLLATGAEPRRLTIDGATLPGVHYLRKLRDSDGLR